MPSDVVGEARGVAPRGRAGRVADALARAERGERVEVREDPRRALVPGGLALLFACAGGVLALGPGPLGYATFLAACGLASALACAFVALRMVRARRNAVLAFDRDGIRYRLRGHDTSLRWLDLSAAFATPAGRRFVVLLIPRDGSDLRGPLAVPSHSEFRAHELIALVRAFGAIGPEAKRPSPSR